MATAYIDSRVQKFFQQKFAKYLGKAQLQAQIDSRTFLGQQFTAAQNPGIFAQNSFLDSSRPATVAPNGQVFQGLVSGNPQPLDAAVAFGTSNAIHIEEAYRTRNDDDQLSRALILYGNHLQAQLEMIPQPPLFYIYDLRANQRYILNDSDEFFDPPTTIYGDHVYEQLPPPNTLFVQLAPAVPEGFYGYLSPNGRYLTVTHVKYDVVNWQMFNEVYSARIKWRIYKNIKFKAPTTGETEGQIVWSDVEAGQYDLVYDGVFPNAPVPSTPETTTESTDDTCYDPITGLYLGDGHLQSHIGTSSYGGGSLASLSQSVRVVPIVQYIEGKPQVGGVGTYTSSIIMSYEGTSHSTNIFCDGTVETETAPTSTTNSASTSGVFFVNKFGDAPRVFPDYELFAYDIDNLQYNNSNSGQAFGMAEAKANDLRWFCFSANPGKEALLVQTTEQSESSSIVKVQRISLFDGSIEQIYQYDETIDGLSDTVLEMLAKIDARIFDSRKTYINVPSTWTQDTFSNEENHGNIFGFGPKQNKVIDVGKVLRLEISPDEHNPSSFVMSVTLYKYDSGTDSFQRKVKLKGKSGVKGIPYIPPDQVTNGSGVVGDIGYISQIISSGGPYLNYYSAGMYHTALGFSSDTFVVYSQMVASTVCDMVLLQ
jgi:hypothetical protein